jgi:hypothetical protein
MRNRVHDEAFFRLGTSVLGFFAGAVIAVLLFAVLVIAGAAETPLPRFAFAGGLAGMAVGVALPGMAVLAFEGVVHFLSGLLIALAGGDIPTPSHERPQWLIAALWVGVIYFFGVWLALHFYELWAKYPS